MDQSSVKAKTKKELAKEVPILEYKNAALKFNL